MDATEESFSADTKRYLFSRVRLELETEDKLMYMGKESIIIQTDKGTYGFFDTDDESHPFVGVCIPVEANPSTPGKFVDTIPEIAKRYLLEKNIFGVTPASIISQIAFKDGMLILEDQLQVEDAERNGYTISINGDVTTFPIESTEISKDSFTEDIPESE